MGISKSLKKPGTWEAYYCKRHPVTKKPIGLRRRAIKSKREALKIEKDLILLVNEKINKAVTPTWGEMVEKLHVWQKEQGLSIKTAESYYLCLKAHTFAFWKDTAINRITGQEIRSIFTGRLGDRSPSHQKNVLKYIRAVFNFALEKGEINRNPTPKMKFKIGEKIKSVLTESQVKILLNQAQVMGSEWYQVWCMALYTGMRNGELYALTWDKVNLEDGKIIVDCSWNNRDGFKDTKSGDDRIVMIAPNLLRMLREMKLHCLDSPFVLPRIDKWDKGEQARELRLFLQGLGLPRIRFHDLRATWATLMLSKGIPPLKVMTMGGWKDLKTMQYYVRKAGVDLVGTTDKLDLHNVDISDRILKLNF